jgi:hypothetical protein
VGEHAEQLEACSKGGRVCEGYGMGGKAGWRMGGSVKPSKELDERFPLELGDPDIVIGSLGRRGRRQRLLWAKSNVTSGTPSIRDRTWLHFEWRTVQPAQTHVLHSFPHINLGSSHIFKGIMRSRSVSFPFVPINSTASAPRLGEF